MSIELATVPLFPDTQYFLDAALEHEEIDASTRVVLDLYGNRSRIGGIVDRTWELGPGEKAPRMLRCAQLIAYADEIMEQLPPPRRAALALAGLLHTVNWTHRCANFLASTAHEDAIWGGAMQPWKRFSRPSPGGRRQDRAELSPKQRRQLFSPAWVRRFIKHESESTRLRVIATRQQRHLAKGVAYIDIAAEARAIDAEVEGQHQNYRRWNERIIQAFGYEHLKRDRPPRALRKKRRRVIQRALTMATSVLGEAQVRHFINGQGVIIDGNQIALEVARAGSSATMGHLGLRVAVLDRTSRRHLANICVYHERTPALDQLTALALGMQSGEEAEIIETGNLSSVSNLGFAHPLVGTKAKEHQRAQAWRPRDAKAAANHKYWLDAQHLWIDPLGIFVFGRRWPDLMKLRTAAE